MRRIDANELVNKTVSTNATVVTASDATIGYVPRSYITSTIPYPTIVGTINTNIPTSKKKVYRCAYCGTLHEHNTGTCDRCGASMGEAVEVAVDPEPVINGTIETSEDDFCLYGEGRCRDCKHWQNQQHLCTLWR